MRRVVVTGLGIISPIGIGAKTFWDNLVGGKCGIRRIEAFDPSAFPSQLAGEVSSYKIADYVPKSYRKATRMMVRGLEIAGETGGDRVPDMAGDARGFEDQTA